MTKKEILLTKNLQNLSNEEKALFDGYWSFPSEPIGGTNPYQKYSYGEISVPEINSNLLKHSEYCSFRKEKICEIKYG